MWQLAQKISHSNIERSAAVLEQLRATVRGLLNATTVFSLFTAMLISGSWGSQQIIGLLVVLALGAVILAVAHKLVDRFTTLALVIWFVSITVLILTLAVLVENPAVVMLLSVLPFVAIITINGLAGIATQGMVMLLIFITGRLPLAGTLAPETAWLTVGAGAFIGLIGWAASKELQDISEWSLNGYEVLRKKLDEVQDRQVELAQSRDDLSLANRELARLTQRLNILEHIAEEARQAKTEFVANVSHELRTPLNMIIGYADLISKSPQVYGGKIPASLITDIRAILRNAQHLSTLVNDVLDLSQVEAGRMAISRDWTLIQNTVNEAVAGIRGLYESKGLYLNVEGGDDLPPVYCDETRIRQVIINLLSNAGRFTQRGGTLVRLAQTEKEVIVSVTDTGPGIEKKDQERIFNPFQQADASVRRQYGGSGLGLTISKQFIEMHGGRMWLESEPGQGTTIRFSLPLGSPFLPGEAAPESGLLRAIIPDDEVGYRIRNRQARIPQQNGAERYVVVDQEQMIEKLLNRYLPDAKVETTPELEEAISRISRSPAQALIINAPNSGEIPSRALRQIPFGTPAITCWIPGEQHAAQVLGVVKYLVKPVGSEKLMETLASLGEKVKTVLIVDDEEDELNLFARHLEAGGRGYAILQVTNGARALDMLRSRKPDVMLLDLNMPGMDGFQVLEEKLHDPQIADIPVIIISSRDPLGDPIISDSFTVIHSGGLTQRNLFTCIHALSSILVPSSVQAMSNR